MYLYFFSEIIFCEKFEISTYFPIGLRLWVVPACSWLFLGCSSLFWVVLGLFLGCSACSGLSLGCSACSGLFRLLVMTFFCRSHIENGFPPQFQVRKKRY